jgi:UDP-N-acetylmuramoyl-tripeptide--D-alanyl-D-alanine ligase
VKAKWGEIRAGEIISPMRGELMSGSPGTVLAGLSTDSRKIDPGQLFCALKGGRYDGHDFVKEAVNKDAAGIVIRKGFRPVIPTMRDMVVIAVDDTLEALGDLGGWWRHQYPIPVAAITGSVGKTTTKEMTASILGLSAMTLKNEGNLNNLIGLPLTLFSLNEAHHRAVLEMGMNKIGEIARLTEIADPNIGLITNVARAHLEGLGHIEAVARAKVELLQEMSEEGQVVLNGDDELLMTTASAFRHKAITYGLGSGNHIRAEKISILGRQGISFELQYFGRSEAVRLRVPGLQNVFNALAASAIALCLKERPEVIVEGLQRFEGLKGRFKVFSLPQGVTLVDDTYNSNPASLKAAIDSVSSLAVHGADVIMGLGEMLELGTETVPAHREAGSMVAKLGNSFLVAMGEHAEEMVEGAVNGGLPAERAVVVNTHEEMVEKIGSMMKRGDVILLKGSRKMGLEKVAEGLKRKYRGELQH